MNGNVLTDLMARISMRFGARRKRHLERNGVADERSVSAIIAERQRAEERTLQHNLVLSGIARIFCHALTCETEEDLGRVCLAVAAEVTGSRFGFIAETNPQTGKLEDIAISDPGWEVCRIREQAGHGKRTPIEFHDRGIYGRVLRDGKSFFTNDPASHPDRLGVPDGHPPLTAFLGVPLLHGGTVAGIVGLANREGGYRKEDADAIEALAPAIVQAFRSKRGEEAIRESELRETQVVQRERAFLRTVIDSVSSLITVKNAEGRILLANEAAARFHGMCVSELEGKRDVDLPTARPELWEQDREVIRTREETLTEVEMIGADGHPHFFIAVKSPMLNPDGTCTAMLESAADVTWRKRAEETLSRANAELAEADRRKDEFIAILSHELRNPLAPIRYALPLIRPEGLDESGARAVNVIARQVDQLTRLVDDLLDVSRITRDKIELRRECVTLRSVLAAAAESAFPAVSAGGHALKVVAPEEQVWLYGDATRLAQVITNLLDNSAKYTPRGGNITLEARRDSDQAVISVRDSGIGIAQEALNTVFDMFRQAHSRDLSQGGLGIGLALVKRLVDMHGGTIEARSGGVGQGAEFVVRLPVVDGVQTGELAKRAKPESDIHRLKVLVVDDNADLVEMIALVVESAGHEVRKAFDGSSAMSTALSYRPDVMLLDVGLPGLNGIEVARELRRRPEMVATRIIAITGWGQTDDRRRTAEAGFDAHLTKPTDPETLQRLLSEFAKEMQA